MPQFYRRKWASLKLHLSACKGFHLRSWYKTLMNKLPCVGAIPIRGSKIQKTRLPISLVLTHPFIAIACGPSKGTCELPSQNSHNHWLKAMHVPFCFLSSQQRWGAHTYNIAAQLTWYCHTGNTKCMKLVFIMRTCHRKVGWHLRCRTDLLSPVLSPFCFLPRRLCFQKLCNSCRILA